MLNKHLDLLLQLGNGSKFLLSTILHSPGLLLLRQLSLHLLPVPRAVGGMEDAAWEELLISTGGSGQTSGLGLQHEVH